MVENGSGRTETSTGDPRVDVAVDVAVVGAGTAGMAAYRAAVRRGSDALLIESGAYGTTCARVGCMPSKLLIAAADAAHHARKADPFGVHASVSVDGHAVMDRVHRERDRFVGFVLESIATVPVERRICGRAHFAGAGELLVEREGEASQGASTRVTAKAIVIATGSTPHIPPIFARIEDRLVVNDDVFAWEDLPASVVVFGAGVIGLELGQALHRLGVRVRVFGRGGTVGPLADPVVKASARAIFADELAIDFEAKVVAVEPEGAAGVSVHFIDKDGKDHVEHFAAALIAAGRRPRLAGLGLDAVGLSPSVPIDRATMRWGTSNVFIAGDVADHLPLLHEAADEGAIAGENAAAYPEVRPAPRRSGLAIAFTDPGLAIVGDGFTAASRGPFVAGEIDFGDQGRSRIMLQNRGKARLYADPTSRRFLGAELVGPRVEHLAHLLAWAHQAGMTVDQMLTMPFYHPVVEEGLRTALRDLVAKLTEPLKGDER